MRDVAHEYGCSWRAADGTVASAWVFAPPVTAARAAELAARGRPRGRLPAGHRRPGVRRSVGRGATVAASIAFHGLFGDAWLSCSLEPAVPGAGAS